MKITLPNNNFPERQYVVNVLFKEFMGLEFELVIDNSVSDWIIHCNNSQLVFEDAFFNNYKGNLSYLKLENLPKKVKFISNQFIVEEDIPVLYGDHRLEIQENEIYCGIDIFASSFFMLTRWEEYVNKNRDNHNRFPATESIALKNNFLDRPIVNEYVEMLKNMLLQLDNSIEFKDQPFNKFITCDVDWPFDPNLNCTKTFIWSFAREFIRNKNFIKSFTLLGQFIKNRLGFSVIDVFRENIDWIMDVNENAGNKVAFYFIFHNTSKLDTKDNFDSVKIRKLLKDIHNRGHEIGVHPGYETYNNYDNFAKTVDKLKSVFKQESIEQIIIGGRQHYLRWDIAQTPGLWDSNGLDYDSTMSYADKPGFRCGTSFEFTIYHFLNRKFLKVKERPLVTMECSIISPKYEGLGYSEESLDRFIYFKDVCRKYGGNYTLLWHNNFFDCEESKSFYKKIIH